MEIWTQRISNCVVANTTHCDATLFHDIDSASKRAIGIQMTDDATLKSLRHNEGIAAWRALARSPVAGFQRAVDRGSGEVRVAVSLRILDGFDFGMRATRT
jgi:hypothetical protein